MIDGILIIGMVYLYILAERRHERVKQWIAELYESRGDRGIPNRSRRHGRW